MNKLRLIKIYEIRKQVHPMEQYVIDFLDGIKKKRIFNTYHLYYKDDMFYFHHYLNSNNVWLSNYFKTKFGCSNEETIEIMKYLLDKHLKIEINEVKIRTQ